MVQYRNLALWLFVLGIFVINSEASQQSDEDSEQGEDYPDNGVDGYYIFGVYGMLDALAESDKSIVASNVTNQRVKREIPKTEGDERRLEMRVARMREMQQRREAARAREAFAREQAARQERMRQHRRFNQNGPRH